LQRPSSKELLLHPFVKKAKQNNILIELIERYKRWKILHGDDSSSESEVGSDKEPGTEDTDWNMTVKSTFSPVLRNDGLSETVVAEINYDTSFCRNGKDTLRSHEQFITENLETRNSLYENQAAQVLSHQPENFHAIGEEHTKLPIVKKVVDPVYENLTPEKVSHDHNHNKEPSASRLVRPTVSPQKTSQSMDNPRRKQEVSERHAEQDLKNYTPTEQNKVKYL